MATSEEQTGHGQANRQRETPGLGIHELLGGPRLASASHMGKNTCQTGGVRGVEGTPLIAALFKKSLQLNVSRNLGKS